MIDQVIAETAFGLKKNEISKPFQGTFSTVIVRATEITPAVEKTFEQVKGELRDAIAKDKAMQEAQALQDKIENARSRGAGLKELAEKHALKLQEIAAVSQDGTDPDNKIVPDIVGASKILPRAFATEVGVEAEGIDLQDGFVTWFEVQGITPAVLRPLDTVKEQVKQDWLAVERRKGLQDLSQKLADRLNKGEALEAIAKELGQKVAATKPLKRDDKADGITAGRGQPGVFPGQGRRGSCRQWQRRPRIAEGRRDHGAGGTGEGRVRQTDERDQQAIGRGLGQPVHGVSAGPLRRPHQQGRPRSRGRPDGELTRADLPKTARKPLGYRRKRTEVMAGAYHENGAVFEPGPEAFATAFSQGKAQVIWTRLVADLETPVSAYMKLAQQDAGKADTGNEKADELPARIGRGRHQPRALFDDRDCARPGVSRPGRTRRGQSPRASQAGWFRADAGQDAGGVAGAAGGVGHRRCPSSCRRWPSASSASWATIPSASSSTCPTCRPMRWPCRMRCLMRPTVMVIFDAIKVEMIVVTPVYPANSASKKSAPGQGTKDAAAAYDAACATAARGDERAR